MEKDSRERERRESERAILSEITQLNKSYCKFNCEDLLCFTQDETYVSITELH